MGYRIMAIYEVWHFEEHTQYHPESREGGLFVDYINTFLKMKQEADGWPAGCDTEADRKAYIDEYEKHEGIRLESIEKNDGQRCCSKLMLNSFWGKYAQRNNLPHKVLLNDLREFYALVSDTSKEVTINRIDEDAMEVTYVDKEDFVYGGPNKNIFIAAYTTAQARLELYFWRNSTSACSTSIRIPSCTSHAPENMTHRSDAIWGI